MRLAIRSFRFFAPLALVSGLTGSALAQTPTTSSGATSGPSVTQPAPVLRPAPPPATTPTPVARASTNATRTVQVLGLDSDNADDQVEALTTALRARVRATSTWTLGGVTTSLSMVTAALKCSQRPAPECTQRMGDEFKADRVMYGWINKSGTHEVTAEVHLWVRGQREVVANETYGDTLVDAKDPKLQAVADRILEKVLGEKPPAAAPAQEVEVAKKKEEEPKPAESHGVSTRTILGWTAIGLGVGAGIFGVVEGARFLSIKSDNKDDANNHSDVRDFCNPGKAGVDTTQACSNYEDGKTARLWEFIGLGAGAALIGTGVVLLLTDHSKEAPSHATATARARKWQVAPSVGPRGGRVDFQLAF